jgi:hypothetical protein
MVRPGNDAKPSADAGPKSESGKSAAPEGKPAAQPNEKK